ncbi:hypothetical protein [Haloarcula sp. Atlit-7R]|uniref:hypothetical protein n=1 Tax=Haloarcula sp. Atlit-7R TaxID=2282125 RepID=UPI000EF14CC5|nr:hypothetical protein [Haloarcula sp. Atlit-7R]RLM94317.1 hypothetical protein D3D01_15760 [Haloarcula sp. Atlit-7R]
MSVPVSLTPHEPWDITAEQTPIGMKVTAERPDRAGWFVLKEYPNGAELSHRYEADLPGGFKCPEKSQYDGMESAVAELERRMMVDAGR